jgi:Putative Flp pilus-assembly TadE/G-like
MHHNIFSRKRHRERGQTILLVAISLVSLLAMAALAIDVVTLYVASSQIQRATDAAALAGAKAIADSGFTSLPSTDPNYNTAQTLAQTMAATAVNSMVGTATINLVSGQLPVMPAPPTFDFTTHPGSFQITVSLKSANLPTFFSKIWSGSAPTVTASATAEAYNPANLPTTTPFTPISLTSVKPWLVANFDPSNNGAHLVDPNTWVVDSGLIGSSFDLVVDCNSGRNNRCGPLFNNPPQALPNRQVQYVPAEVTTPNTQNVCPACKGTTDYEQSIECADVATSYQVLNCGGGAVQIQWDDGINPGANGNNATGLGGQCLINPLGTGQDILTEPNPIFSAPYQIKQQASGNLVTTSNSIVTIPILDVANQLPHHSSAVTVDGFLQAFINEVDTGAGGGSSPPPAGSINITVLNIVGCSTVNNGATPVVGGSGTSPIPVRLITAP